MQSIQWTIVLFFLLHWFSSVSQLFIGQIRLLPLGSVVTCTGTVTSGPEFGQIRYMQDSTGGIAVYSPLLSSTQQGDEIVVKGTLSLYRGELQITSLISVQLLNTGNPIEIIPADYFADISSSVFESRKVKISCAGISSCESSLQGEWYVMYDQQGNAARLWVENGHPVSGFPITEDPVIIEGIWTRFEDQYQLKCQQISTTVDSNCFTIPKGHLIFTAGEAGILWNNISLGVATVEYGQYAFTSFLDMGNVDGSLYVPIHLLSQDAVYKTRLRQETSSGGISYSLPTYVSPVADEELQIEILFNRTIASSFSDGSAPFATGSSVIEADLIRRINETTWTLDVAMYNTTRDPIVQALKNAVQRGVVVRYIADDETSNSALSGSLPFPVFFRSGSGIMHHKFIVGDADHALNAFVWTGSTNLSTNQLASDPNHAYVIRDQGLALNYKREFEEIWGLQPGHSGARFGDTKTDNTVHAFKMGQTLIESYFSPSDETHCHITDAIQSANHHIQIGLLLLTRDDMVTEIIRLHQEGVDVRIIIEDESSSFAAISRLKEAGVPVLLHDLATIFHHKYAIIDEGYPASDPMVITGSHNWTWSADNINDENTLIIHNQSVANIFRQEFEARWSELNTTSTYNLYDDKLMAYPNPATSFIHVSNPSESACGVDLVDVHGRILHNVLLEPLSSQRIELPAKLSRGIYMLHWKWDHKNQAYKKMVRL